MQVHFVEPLIYSEAMLQVYSKAMLQVYSKAMLQVYSKAMLQVSNIFLLFAFLHVLMH